MGQSPRYRIWFTRPVTGRTPRTQDAKALPDIATDDQTGKAFEVVHEGVWATLVASISAIYLIGVLAFLLWLAFDTWAGRNYLLLRLGYDQAILASGSFRLMAFVAIGGALGGTVDGVRSIIAWHAERHAYGPRFFWKDLALPLLGAAVGLIAYLTVRGGVGVFSGDFTLEQNGRSPTVIAFAVSALAGFSALQVFRWLDARANAIFSVTNVTQTIVPDMRGMRDAEVTAALKSRKLTPGTVTGERAWTGRVVSQSPAGGTKVAEQTPVDIGFDTVGDPDTR